MKVSQVLKLATVALALGAMPFASFAHESHEDAKVEQAQAHEGQDQEAPAAE